MSEKTLYGKNANVADEAANVRQLFMRPSKNWVNEKP